MKLYYVVLFCCIASSFALTDEELVEKVSEFLDENESGKSESTNTAEKDVDNIQLSEGTQTAFPDEDDAGQQEVSNTDPASFPDEASENSEISVDDEDLPEQNDQDMSSWDDDKFEEKEENHIMFVNQFAVELDGDLEEAELIASIYGFQVKNVRYLQGVYLFTHPATPKRSKRSADNVLQKLIDDPHVRYVEQQKHLRRVKRDTSRSQYAEAVRDMYDELTDEINRRKEKRTVGQVKREFNDPQYGKQWYLTASSSHVTRSAGSRPDLNLGVVWESGFSGKGVVITVIDDGIQHNHTDLRKNYDPRASGDLNDDDDDPMPNFQVSGNDHGTHCAGAIAAEADNSKCGIGVAFNSGIGGVRVLDGQVTDLLESEALSFALGYVDIYSASWGPTDDGKQMEGPGHFASVGFDKAINEGRGGKGSIFVWASGNGGIRGDTGNADGYVSSIYTIAIGSVDGDGESSYFNEPASSIMAVIVTGGRKGAGMEGPPGNVVTTGWHDKCMETFGGTSAAAPLMAGCIALVLEANPDLTWRDVQHIVVQGARLITPDIDRWRINGAGYHVSHEFGFGLADCGLMVKLAQDWTAVPPQHVCHVQDANNTVSLTPNATVTLTLTTDGCADSDDVIDKLEHVEVNVNISHPRRGDVRLVLVSPYGTRSTILKTRSRDDNTDIDFKFMSVHFWGENPRGTWTLEVSDIPLNGDGHTGEITHFSMILYGTKGYIEGKERRQIVSKKKLEEIHENELNRSRRISLRRKRDGSVKEPGESTESPKKMENSETLLTPEEIELVKRVLNDLESVDRQSE